MLAGPNVYDLIQAMDGFGVVGIVSVSSPLSPDSCRVLVHGSHAVLTNSGHEPFGLVGLETTDPREFIGLFAALRRNPIQERAIRRAGRLQILQRNLFP